MLGVRARIADLIPAWKKDWSVKVEPFDRLLVGDTPAPVDLRRARCRRPGAADCLREHHQPAAGEERRARQGDRRCARRSARLADALRRSCWSKAWCSGRSAAWPASASRRHRSRSRCRWCRGLPFTAEITLNLARPRVCHGGGARRLDPGRSAAGASGCPPGRRRRRSTTRRADRRARTTACAAPSSAAEVAVSVVLICGAALLFKSLVRMQQVDIGARIDRVITMAIDLPYAALSERPSPRGVLSHPDRAASRHSRRIRREHLRRRAARGHRRRESPDAGPRRAAAGALQARRRRLLRDHGHRRRRRDAASRPRIASARPMSRSSTKHSPRGCAIVSASSNPVGQAVDLPALGIRPRSPGHR